MGVRDCISMVQSPGRCRAFVITTRCAFDHLTPHVACQHTHQPPESPRVMGLGSKLQLFGVLDVLPFVDSSTCNRKGTVVSSSFPLCGRNHRRCPPARTADLASPYSAAAFGRLTALVRSRDGDLIKRRYIAQSTSTETSCS